MWPSGLFSWGNFYPRSPCGERLEVVQHRVVVFGISIHALLAESDNFFTVTLPTGIQFLSTLSLRRATFAGSRRPPGGNHFYPRSPCGERHRYRQNRAIMTGDFYPRSPCGERQKIRQSKEKPRHFYPRSPCGERRRQGRRLGACICISIHALLAESDCQIKKYSGLNFAHFYPRSPCGERLVGFGRNDNIRNFYPRSPCGERQHAYQLVLWVLRFLSTLSLRRATCSCRSVRLLAPYFYPRSPCGERL